MKFGDKQASPVRFMEETDLRSVNPQKGLLLHVESEEYDFNASSGRKKQNVFTGIDMSNRPK